MTPIKTDMDLVNASLAAHPWLRVARTLMNYMLCIFSSSFSYSNIKILIKSVYFEILKGIVFYLSDFL